MTKKEIIAVLTLLAGNYESFAKRTETDEQVKIMVDVWQECMGDLEYPLVLKAIKKCIIDSPYPPTIHDIRKNAMEIMNPIEDKRLEAWDECYKMICRGSVITQDEFDKHSDICKKFLGSVDQLRNYARTDTSTINTVVKSSFLKQYDVFIERQKQENLLPDNFKEQLGNIGNIKKLEEKKV